MKKLKNMGLITQTTLLVIIALLIFSLTLALIVQHQVREGVEKFALEKATSDLALSYNTLELNYPGEWQVINGELYKGEVKINDNNEIVDEIAEITKEEVTIFLEDTRVATTILSDNNERITGTTASETVVKTVLEQGQNYYGSAVVEGNEVQAAYAPILDENGEVIGIWFVGVPRIIIDEINASIMYTFLGVLVGIDHCGAGIAFVHQICDH